MSDVGKVRGDKSGPEPSGVRKKKGRDSDAFKEMMKVGKVRETDPEEKRKRKRQAEHEEEAKAEQATSVPRQGLEPEAKEPSPYEPTARKEAFIAREPTTPSAQRPDDSRPKPPSAPLPSQRPPEEEPYPPSGPEMPPGPQQPQRRKKAQRKEAAPPTEKKPKPEKATKQKKKAVTPPSPEKAKLEKAQKKEKKPLITGPTPKPKKGVTPEAKPPLYPEKLVEKAKAPLEEIKEIKEPEKKKKEEVPPMVVPPGLPEGAWESTKALEKEEEKEPSLGVPTTPAGITQPQAPTPLSVPEAQPLTPLAAPFANLPPQVSQIFERMVGVMTVMHETGINQTTINLDNPQFAKSVFYGAQIIVTEFSTAPKAFNIELLGNQQAVNLFVDNSEELVAAFQAGNYNFKVNRIDTSYLPVSTETKKRATRRVKRKKSGGT